VFNDAYIVSKLKEGLDATKPVVVDKELVEYEDYKTRLDYIKTIKSIKDKHL